MVLASHVDSLGTPTCNVLIVSRKVVDVANSSSPTSSTGSPSSKGKGKRPFKGKTYFVEYEYVPENVQDINMLSLLENEDMATVAASWVVLDTGATESVAGVAAMTRLRTHDHMDGVLHHSS